MYLGVAVDPGDERIQNDDFIVLFRENEAEKRGHERWLRDGSQEEIQIRRCRGHFLQRILRGKDDVVRQDICRNEGNGRLDEVERHGKD